jgi:hypothetical protein
MTANQRRTGFRMPWTSDDDAREEGAATPSPQAGGADPSAPASSPPNAAADDPAPASAAQPTDVAPEPTPVPPTAGESGGEAPDDFMRGLVDAMRKVADEAKQTGLTEVRSRADERIRQLEREAEQRRQDLGRRAEVDVAAVGEWASAEAARIKAEAERRVSARRAQLEEQLAADAGRAERETKGVRDVVAEYEQELEAYHAQLAEINDPAAFAAAAKRMPRPPALRGSTADEDVTSSEAVPTAPTPADAPVPDGPGQATTNGVGPKPAEVHPAEEEVLAARLAELDSSLPAEAPTEGAAPAAAATTEVVVTGLGSFGAITSFRQSLADVDGVEGVALSLGQSGEFIFRATHRAGFDVRDAITALEGDAAAVQPRAEGGYLVKLERAR